MSTDAMLRMAALLGAVHPIFSAPFPPKVTQGMLVRLDAAAAECPLKHTDVKAEISGFLARVTVTQEFENTASEKIEAVYVFPLSQNSAVDDMTMHVGKRTVRGLIKRRDEARAMYEAARAAGKVAGLLDQERPNIFTQSVANIMPGEKVRIVISYVEYLKYEDGVYEFVFPMVVGPRYIPGNPAGKAGGGWSWDTDRVPDASKITPIVAKPGTRAGHDISIQVKLDAGVPIDSVTAPSHQVLVTRQSPSMASVKLQQQSTIPNKDFILKYDVAGRQIEDSVLTHRGEKGGFFSMILQPPGRLEVEDITPKEIVFVLDTSGSMTGFPIEKAKEAMKLAIDGLNPDDRFNLITFAGDTHVLFPAPVAATPANLAQAQQFLASRRGSGGTEMMKAIRAALAPSGEPNHVRIVCFMTDGYVGNEAEIISEIQRYSQARVFSFGIGSSVNRYLLDKMAEHGRGEVEYVGLNDDGSAAAKRFHQRVRNPVLTDISVEWNGLPVADLYPKRIPDLFSAKPMVITGRYTSPAKGFVRLRGKVAGRPVTREIALNLPASQAQHDVLATLWARAKVDDLMHTQPVRTEEITEIGLKHGIMTPYTSFIAVEEMVITDGGQPRRVEVPVELPEGVSYEGVFGKGEAESRHAAGSSLQSLPASLAPQKRAMRTMADLSSREELGRRQAGPRSKLDPALSAQGADKVEVQIWLTERSPQVLAELKKLGFELIAQPESAKTVIGRIAGNKLEALSNLAAVLYISPHRNR